MSTYETLLGIIYLYLDIWSYIAQYEQYVDILNNLHKINPYDNIWNYIAQYEPYVSITNHSG